MNIAYGEALKGAERGLYSRRTVIPLNRLETTNGDLLAALLHCWSPAVVEQLGSDLRRLSGRDHVFFAPSARCAIARVLSALPQSEVVLPAYSCPVVRQAAEAAGKRLIYVDVAKNSVNATAEEFEPVARPGRILVPTHVFGIPVNVQRICDLARERNCVVIEDAAGAFPSRNEGRLLGTFGDVGIISFERSKRVPAFRGAAIIINTPAAIDTSKLATHHFGPTKTTFPLQELLFGLAYNIATVPWLYGRVFLPQMLRHYAARLSPTRVKDNGTLRANKFYTHEFHPYQAALVHRLLSRVDTIRAHIIQLVSVYTQAFRGSSIQFFMPPLCDATDLLRFPIALPGSPRREVLRAALRRGIFLETNFELPLADPPDYGRLPNSQWATNNVILLPLYSRLSESAAARLATQMIEIQHELTYRTHSEAVPAV